MTGKTALKHVCAQAELAEAIEQHWLAFVKFLGRVSEDDAEAMAQEKLRGVKEEAGEVLECDAAEFRVRLGERMDKKRRGGTAGVAGADGGAAVVGGVTEKLRMGVIEVVFVESLELVAGDEVLSKSRSAELVLGRFWSAELQFGTSLWNQIGCPLTPALSPSEGRGPG